MPYGPYQLPLESWRYHIGNFQQIPADCPNPGGTKTCNQNYFNAVRDAWNAAVPAAERATFDNA